MRVLLQILLLLVQQTLAECSNHCINCLDGENCGECEPNFYVNYDKYPFSCVPCYSGCKNCYSSSNTYCTNCEEGYYFNQYNNTRGSCNLCPTNCSACISSDLCTLCKKGFYLSNNQCFRCPIGCNSCSGSSQSQCNECSPGYYYDNTKCSQCQSHCNECLDGISCTKCEDGYYLNSDNQCYKCINDCIHCTGPTIDDCVICEGGYYFDNFICKQCDTNCKTCIDNSTKCTSCKTNQYLSNNTCYDNCNDGCKTCDDDRCTECDDEYYLYRNRCHPCKSENCKTCRSNVFFIISCLSCYEGFYLSGHDCMECPAGCLSCNSSDTCTSCQPGYVLINGTKCFPCDISCSKCIDEPTKCTECFPGYSFNENHKCVKYETNSIPISISAYFMSKIGDFSSKRGQCYSNPHYCDVIFYSRGNNLLRIEYNFTGEAFQIYGSYSPHLGYFEVFLDGQYLTTINQYRSSITLEYVRQYDSDLLNYGEHNLSLVGVGQFYEAYKITYWPNVKAKRVNATDMELKGPWVSNSDYAGGSLLWSFSNTNVSASTFIRASKFWIYGTFDRIHGSMEINFGNQLYVVSEKRDFRLVNVLVFESPTLESSISDYFNIYNSGEDGPIEIGYVFYLDIPDQTPTISPEETPTISPEETPTISPTSTQTSTPIYDPTSAYTDDFPSSSSATYTSSQSPTPMRSLIPQLPVLSISSDSITFEINSQGFIDDKNNQIQVDNSTQVIKGIFFESKNIEIKESSTFYSQSPMYFIPLHENTRINIDKDFSHSNIGVYSTNNPTVIIKSGQNSYLSFMNQLQRGGEITIEADFDDKNELKFNEIINQMGDLKIRIPSEFDEIKFSKLIMQYYSSLSINQYSISQTKILSNEKTAKLRILDNFSVLKESEINIDNLCLDGILSIYSDCKMRVENEISFGDQSSIEILVVNEKRDELSGPVIDFENRNGIPTKIVLKPESVQKFNISLFESGNNKFTCAQIIDHLYIDINNVEKKMLLENCFDSSGSLFIEFSDPGSNDAGGNSGKTSFPLGAIIGIVVGVVVIIIVVVVLVILMMKRRNNNKVFLNEFANQTSTNNDDDTITEKESNLAI